MAEESGKSALERVLGRADGGLLALNFAALTFVAGIAALSDLPAVVNLKLLVGGLCGGLFFAILCTYFTIFGVRATAASDRRAGNREPFVFDTELPMPGGPRGAGRPPSLIGALLVCLLPILLIFICMQVGSASISEAGKPLAETTRDAAEACVPAAKDKSDQVKAVQEEACKKAREKQVAPAKVHDARAFWGTATNLVIIVCIVFYLVVPFLLWRSAATFAKPPEYVLWLAENTERIQMLRLASALISLAAFMIGVGLSLVNVSVASVGAGLADGNAVASAARDDTKPDKDFFAGPPGASGAAGQRGDNGEKGDKGIDGKSAEAVGAGPVFPDKIDLNVKFGEITWPAQVVGTTTQPQPSPPVVNFPSVITLRGLPEPKDVKVDVNVPKPDPAPPPATAEEIVEALAKRDVQTDCTAFQKLFLQKCAYRVTQRGAAASP